MPPPKTTGRVMKVTNGDIWRARTALQPLLKQDWPPKTAYWLLKLARFVNQHAKDIQPVHDALIQRHGTVDDKGQGSIKPSDMGWSEFVTQYEELMNVEVEIEIEHKIVIPDIEGARVSPATLLDLEAFVEVA